MNIEAALAKTGKTEREHQLWHEWNEKGRDTYLCQVCVLTRKGDQE
jgi:hypothetical protein